MASLSAGTARNAMVAVKVLWSVPWPAVSAVVQAAAVQLMEELVTKVIW